MRLEIATRGSASHGVCRAPTLGKLVNYISRPGPTGRTLTEMLLLPYRDKSVARSVPVVTAFVALACIVVLFGYQSRDAAREEHAAAFYRESGLEKIELAHYQNYLAERTDPESSERLHLLRNAPIPVKDQLLQSDARFVRDLHALRIIREGEPEFAQWKADRARFDDILGKTVPARFGLERGKVDEWWRFVTYAFVHGGVGHLVGNLLVLALVGPFVESALGSLRFALAYIAGAAAAGMLQILVADGSVVGASGAIAATVGMLAVLYGTRRIPVFFLIFVVFGSARIPALALIPVWLLNEGYQWFLQSRSPIPFGAVAYGAHVGGLVAGAALAYFLRPRNWQPVVDAASARASPQRRTEQGSTLAAQAQDAAAHLDIKRATRLYKELVDFEPARIDYVVAYLNVALLGADEEALQDAALRLLWTKYKHGTEELRKAFMQLTQPKVLKSLPIDEHLRLARRLVRFREDAAALRVIDDLLRDDHLRELYGRQLADCLLGQINARLRSYFPSADEIGGMAPSNRPPSTILSSLRPTISRMTLQRPEPAPEPGRPTSRSD
jgi:membrane associated rhomboid family serine protease